MMDGLEARLFKELMEGRTEEGDSWELQDEIGCHAHAQHSWLLWPHG